MPRHHHLGRGEGQEQNVPPAGCPRKLFEGEEHEGRVGQDPQVRKVGPAERERGQGEGETPEDGGPMGEIQRAQGGVCEDHQKEQLKEHGHRQAVQDWEQEADEHGKGIGGRLAALQKRHSPPP